MAENPVDLLAGQLIVRVESRSGTCLVFACAGSDSETGHARAPVWELRGSDGRMAVSDSWDDVPTAARLREWQTALVGREIRCARVDDGVLELRLSDASTLRASPHESYEAWEVGGAARFVVCAPGGKTVVFDHPDDGWRRPAPPDP